ncbi:unnamed protein product [Sphagnum troendelagicum]|uniref:S-acyltransferase n=2 Tax=Sphagnum TaxID=13804 RepID=A0ABP0V618_9BRYO
MDFGRFVSLPVVVVLLIMGFVYHTVVVWVIQPWLSLSTASGLANAMLLTALCIMALVSYALAVIQDPGRVPSSYLPDLEDSAITLHEVKRKGGDLRYCQKCGHYKPPRAHHCRVCRRCVLRMDHHCVWINNCVGHNNYKVFFLFVLYLVAASLQSLVNSSLDSKVDLLLNVLIAPAKRWLKNSSVICTIVVLAALVTVGLLLAWHVYLLLHNKTTIEYHEGVRARWLAEKAGQNYRHPYDVGVFTNLSMALGHNVACWLCPTARGHLGSGLRFRTFSDDLSHTQQSLSHG